MKKTIFQSAWYAALCLAALQTGQAAMVIAFSETDAGKMRLQMRGQIDNYNGSELLSNTPTPWGSPSTYSAIMANNSFFVGYNNNSAGNHTYSLISMSANNWQNYVGGFYVTEPFLDKDNNIVTIPVFGFSNNTLVVDSEYEFGTYLDIDVIADVDWSLRVSRPTPSQGDSATFSWDGGNQSMTFQIGALAPVPEPSTTALFGLAGALVLIRRRETS